MVSFIILGIGILATAYVALMYENTELMLLVYVQAALFVLSAFTVWYRKFTIRGKIEVPVSLAESGKDILVKVVLTNKGHVPMARLKAKVAVEDSGTGKVKTYWMRFSAVPGQGGSFARTISFGGTGNYCLRLKKLRVYDFTGLLFGTVRVKSEAKVQVLPALYDMPVRLSHGVKNFYGEAEVYDEHLPGHDNNELFDVREYQKGDRLQNIHWKLTAKQDDLMVKEHALPKACPVVLLLDYHEKKRRRDPRKMISYLEAAASLSFSIMDAGCPHYVVWYDEREQDIVRIRVDEEESLFYFLGLLMQISWKRSGEALLLRYKEKYKGEPFVWAISLNEKLVLKKGEEVLAELSSKDIEKSLAQTELLL